MSQSNEIVVSEIIVKGAPAAPSAKCASSVTSLPAGRDATKDAGRVRLGAGMIRF